MEMAGLGSEALRLIGTDAAGRMLMPALAAAISADRAAGLHPFLVVGTAGRSTWAKSWQVPLTGDLSTTRSR